jgi:hypothetical protein
MKNWKKIFVLILMIFTVNISFSQVIIKPFIIIINKKLVNFYHISEISIKIKDDKNNETTFPIKYQIGSIKIDSLDYNKIKESLSLNLYLRVDVFCEQNPAYVKNVGISTEILTKFILNSDYFVLEIQTDPELFILMQTSQITAPLFPNSIDNLNYSTIISQPSY